MAHKRYILVGDSWFYTGTRRILTHLRKQLTPVQKATIKWVGGPARQVVSAWGAMTEMQKSGCKLFAFRTSGHKSPYARLIQRFYTLKGIPSYPRRRRAPKPDRVPRMGFLNRGANPAAPPAMPVARQERALWYAQPVPVGRFQWHPQLEENWIRENPIAVGGVVQAAPPPQAPAVNYQLNAIYNAINGEPLDAQAVQQADNPPRR